MTQANVETTGAAPPDAVRDAAQRLKRWLFNDALPIWWERGADVNGGGFFERLGHDGAPVDMPPRFRVQARQTHVYALAKKLGWSGPGEAAHRHGLTAVLVGSSRVDLQACKLEYSIVSPK